MHGLALAAGVLLIGWVLWDAFETILLPRRVPARLRVSRFFLRWLWGRWAGVARRIEHRPRRENFLGFFALLAILGLFAVWFAVLITGFAVVLWACGSHVEMSGERATFAIDLYLSGTTFFTLGLGDVRPITALARATVVIEAGTGFGFLALVISYLPVLYTAFSRREARITMLDEWAGSPPTAAVLLRRCFEARDPNVLTPLFRDWEVASAEILESHLSYPILCFFRSQHDNQSWLASLVAILDTCAYVIVGVEGIDPFQARLTFAIGRHVLVDLSQTLRLQPRMVEKVPVEPATLAELRHWLAGSGARLAPGAEADRKLAELRALYMPYAEPLAERLMMPLPPCLPPPKARYNWETTAWGRTATDDGH
jgi:hypothetical protein